MALLPKSFKISLICQIFVRCKNRNRTTFIASPTERCNGLKPSEHLLGDVNFFFFGVDVMETISLLILSNQVTAFMLFKQFGFNTLNLFILAAFTQVPHTEESEQFFNTNIASLPYPKSCASTQTSVPHRAQNPYLTL